jgi:hypothetical protein
MSKSKYGNKTCIIDDIKFQSIKEGARYSELKLLKKAGLIKEFTRQPMFVLQDGYRRKDGKKIIAIKYFADFAVTYPNGTIEYEDVKSPATLKKESFVIKRKLLEAKFDLILKIV